MAQIYGSMTDTIVSDSSVTMSCATLDPETIEAPLQEWHLQAIETDATMGSLPLLGASGELDKFVDLEAN